MLKLFRKSRYRNEGEEGRSSGAVRRRGILRMDVRALLLVCFEANADAAAFLTETMLERFGILPVASVIPNVQLLSCRF